MVLLLIFLVISIYLYKNKKRPIDYYNLFIIGVVWLPIGIATQNASLLILGLVFMTIGLINKNKWKANRLRWKDLNKNEKLFRIIIMLILLVLIISGLILTFLGKI